MIIIFSKTTQPNYNLSRSQHDKLYDFQPLYVQEINTGGLWNNVYIRIP